MNRIGVDIRGKSAKNMIVSKLKKLKTTINLDDMGEYFFSGTTGWYKIIIDTTKTEVEVDAWLYNLRMPPIKDGWDYGTFSLPITGEKP